MANKPSQSSKKKTGVRSASNSPSAGSKKKASPKRSVAAAKVDRASGQARAGDWREELLSRVRKIVKEALPEAVEEAKWRKPSNGMRGIPVWSQDGIICTGETYKDYVKLTFAQGAALPDPSGVFNAGLQGGTRRAIDIRQGDRIDERALKVLIRAAAAFNAESRTK